MSQLTEDPSPAAARHSWRKRLVHLGSIFLIVLSGYYALKDVYDVLHEMHNEVVKQETDSDTRSFTGRLQNLVRKQLAELTAVNPTALGGTFTDSLENLTCTWFVSCTRIEHPVETVQFGQFHMDLPVAAPPPPKLIIKIGPIPIPTWHTISGAPRATIDSARAIAKAGVWAIAMFASCTVIWIALLIGAARGETPLAAYFMLIGGPLGISLMVLCVQHICLAVLNTFGLLGCVLAVGITGLLHSAALALAVGFRHIAKTPHELLEETHKLKSV